MSFSQTFYVSTFIIEIEVSAEIIRNLWARNWDMENCPKYNYFLKIRKWMRGTLGFSVLRCCLFFISIFPFLIQKTSVSRFRCSLRFAYFPFFSIWFSVFTKNIWYPMRFSVFPFDLFGFRFLSDLSGNYAPRLISNSSQTQMLSRRMHDKPIEIS